MLRTILLLIALLLLIVLGLVWAGVIQLREQPGGGVAVETSDVEVGTTSRNLQVPLPTVDVKDGNQAAPQPANQQ